MSMSKETEFLLSTIEIILKSKHGRLTSITRIFFTFLYQKAFNTKYFDLYLGNPGKYLNNVKLE